MTQRTSIRIGIVRKSFNDLHKLELYKTSRKREYVVLGNYKAHFRGTMEELKAWAAAEGLRIDATNKLGRELLNA